MITPDEWNAKKKKRKCFYYIGTHAYGKVFVKAERIADFSLVRMMAVFDKGILVTKGQSKFRMVLDLDQCFFDKNEAETMAAIANEE